MKYEMRVVAFIDILGFRGVLDETVKKDGRDDEAKIDAVVAGRRRARIKRLRLLV